MTIFVNGKERPLNTPVSVKALLDSIGLGDKPVVVALNKTALFPREYTESQLEDDDQVEIITIAAGGQGWECGFVTRDRLSTLVPAD